MGQGNMTLCADKAALYKFLPTAASVVVIVTACLDLIGWLFDLPSLEYVLPGLPKMTANTAVTFVLAGLSLWLYSKASGPATGRDRQRRLAQGLAVLVTLIGLLTLSEYLFGWDIGLDQLLVKDLAGAVETSIPGRPSPHTALTFVFIGVSLIGLRVDSPRRHWLAQYFILTAAFIALLALVGYGFGVSFFFRISAYTGMALHTALAFIVLCAGLLFLHPDGGFMALMTTANLGGVMARRLVLVAIGVPLLIGWISTLGERAGLYSTEFEPVLLAVLSAYAYSGAIWWYASSLNRIDANRKQAEGALQRSQQVLQLFVENAPAAIAMFDREMRYIAVSRRYLIDYELGDQDLVDRSHYEVFPEISERWKEIHRRCLGGATERADEDPFPRVDGTLDWVRWEIHPWYEDTREIGGIILFSEVITERKRVEEESHLKDELLQMTGEMAKVGGWEFDAQTLEGTWTDEVARIHDLDPSQPTNVELGLSFYLPEHREKIERAVNAAIEFAKPYDLELEMVSAKGDHKWVRTMGLPIMDGGKVIKVKGIFQDITAHKQLEEERLKLEKQFYQAQKMEAVGQLTAGIAHDFNNLLTAINGFAGLMQLELPPDDPNQESVDRILRSGQRAAGLVRQLLAFSRKQIIELRVLNLNTTVAEMDKLLRRIIGEDIKLKTSLSPDLWQVKVDPTQIEQIIINLAVNARDAMPKGGRLTIETTNVMLDNDYAVHHLEAQSGEYVLLAISDTGHGMSEEVQAHIFEPFFTTKEQGKGTGLGLATVYGIVRQNGGNIWIYSEPGIGTTFKIYLPRAEEEVPSSASIEFEAEMLSGNETILLVEDDVEVRNLVRRVLQAQGYTLLEAAEGREALQLAAYHTDPIHLLLTDVIMPGMNGKLLAEKLVQLQPDLKILFMSGYTDNVIAHHGVLDPGVFLLQKPFGFTTLAHKVRSVLDS